VLYRVTCLIGSAAVPAPAGGSALIGAYGTIGGASGPAAPSKP
jgi:hypothetical protein